MRRPARGVTAVIAALGAALAIGIQPASATVLWTMTASPSTGAVGVGTVFTFTATNLDPLLGVKCVVVEIPASIEPGDAWIAGSNTTAPWTTMRSGQLLTAVIDTGDGDEKLRVGDWVNFALSGVPFQGGTYAFHAVAYSGHECVNGARGLAAPPVVVISGPVATEPPPAPTPEPTPIPIPQPLPPLPPLPPILPTPTPQPRVVAITPRPVATESPSASPSAATSPSPSPAGAPPGRPPNPPPQVLSLAAEQASATLAASDGAGAAAPRAIALAEEIPDVAFDLSLGPLGVADGLSVWAIPGAVVGGPGLLVIVWVAFQAGVAAVWIPAVRALRGTDGRPGPRGGPVMP
jgi:hypothetical protein